MLKKWILNIGISTLAFFYVIAATQAMYKVRTAIEIWNVLLRLCIIFALLIGLKKIIIRVSNYFSMKKINQELSIIQQKVIKNTSNLDVNKKYKILFVTKTFLKWKKMLSTIDDGITNFAILHITSTTNLSDVIEMYKISNFVDVLIVEEI